MTSFDGVVTIALLLIGLRNWSNSLPASDDVREFYIREELPPRSFVCNLVRELSLEEKYDSATVNRLRFSFLTRPLHFDRDYFAIDERSGVILTTERLDREVLCPGGVIDCVAQYDVAIKPIEFFQIIKVKIEIIDENDHAPEFPTRQVQHRLAESSEPDSSGIPIPPAVDLDSGRNGIQKYQLVSTTNHFRLSERQTADGATDLRLVLTERLDRELEDRYQLAVIAIDGGEPPKSGSILIDIGVIDVNDNSPIFDNNATYEVRVSEDVSAGTQILRVRARDSDLGPNGAVAYSFSPLTERQHGRVFGIRPDSGKIYVKPAPLMTSSSHGIGALDHESAAVHLLSVIAVDSGQDPLTAHATVIVRVDDVNDNSPIIRVTTLVTSSSETDVPSGDKRHPARAQVNENASPGTFVAYVSVSDPDSGDYGRFRCTVTTSGLSSSTDATGNADYPFALRQTFPPADFQLVAVTSLDRERQAGYDVTVGCSDGGGRSSTYLVRVDVIDENDNRPVFSRDSPYEFEVSENSAVGTVVGRVSATDNDDSPNGDVTYRLSAPDRILSRFVIDRRSGVITTRDEIDRESFARFMTSRRDDDDVIDNEDGVFDEKTSLELKVIASDSGSPVKSSTAAVQVHIVDVDDERPVFDVDRYVFRIAENQPSGTIVGQVHASDSDSPPNNRFRYHVTDRDESRVSDDVELSSEFFEVDPLLGILSTRLSFDHERSNEYHLVVIAKPEVADYVATTRVTVRVDDVNDHKPMFVVPLADNETVLVSSRAPQGHLVITLQAVDHDARGGPNSALTYAIVSGGGSMFVVNPRTGRLTVRRPLADIVLRDFLLRLAVTDAGNPISLNSTTQLRVVVSRDVHYIPSQVYSEDDQDDVTNEGFQLHGVLYSESTAVVLGVALSLILTAILVVAVTICIVRCRLRSRRGVLLAAGGHRRAREDSDDEKENKGRHGRTPGINGLHREKGHPHGKQYPPSSADHDHLQATALLQNVGRGEQQVTCVDVVAPLVSGVVVTSREPRHQHDDVMASTMERCGGQAKTYLTARPPSSSLSSFTLGGLARGFSANSSQLQQHSPRYVSTMEHLSLDRRQGIDAVQHHSTMEETIADRKPVVVFVKDLSQQKQQLLTSPHHVTVRQMLDLEHESVGSASNTDSGNGNSEYSGPDSDPSPPMMTSSNALALPVGRVASSTRPSNISAFHNLPPDVSMETTVTSSSSATNARHVTYGCQTLPARGLAQRRTSAGNEALAPGPEPPSTLWLTSKRSNENSNLPTSGSTVVRFADNIGMTSYGSRISSELDVSRESARGLHGRRQRNTSQSVTSSGGLAFVPRSFGHSLQNLPDTSL